MAESARISRPPFRQAWVVLMFAAAVGAAFWGFAGSYLAEGLRGQQRVAMAKSIAERAAEHEAFTTRIASRQAREMKLLQGESLPLLLARAGAPWKDINASIYAVGEVADARRLRPGQEVSVFFEPKDGQTELTGLAFRSEAGTTISVARIFTGSFEAREIEVPTTKELARLVGTVDRSLYEAVLDGGATEKEVATMADIFAYDVDFQREIFRGDQFELLFERYYDEEGRTVKTGELLYASLNARNGAKALYRFTPPGSTISEWFDATGRAAKKFLMKTPINGARLASGFGMRSHPILGFSRMHKGIDFAAPVGTPIMAAGDGVVEFVGFSGAYGRLVRLQHSDGFETQYAHMSAFGPGVGRGARVAQGQVIGYVGTSGLSTGPHLHYEILVRGAHINPMSLRVPTGRNLEGQALAAFAKERARIDLLRAGGPTPVPEKPKVETVAFRPTTPKPAAGLN